MTAEPDAPTGTAAPTGVTDERRPDREAVEILVALDGDARIVGAGGAPESLGHDPESLIGQPLDRVFPLEAAAEIRRWLETGATDGHRVEVEALRVDGHTSPVEISLSVLHLPTGTARILMVRTIGARKGAEAALRGQERQLDRAEQIAHLGSWEWDVEADVVTWSKELYRIYGLEPDSVALDYEGFLERVHPHDRKRVRRAIERAYARRSPFTFLHRIVRPDGTVRVLHARGEVVSDEDGRIARLVGTGQDITEQRRAEKRARQLLREQAAREAAERAAQRMHLLAEAGRLLSASLEVRDTLASLVRLVVPQVADLCAVHLVEGDEIDLVELAHANASKAREVRRLLEDYPFEAEDPAGIAKVIETGQPDLLPEIEDGLLRRLARDPDHLERMRGLGFESALVVPLVGRDGIIGTLSLVIVGSGRRYGREDLFFAERLAAKAALSVDNARLYERERRARAVAEQASRVRDEVLAIVSHDLRTPLNAINLSAELLRTEQPEEIRRRQVDGIQRGVREMARLVKDLLDVGRLETGRFQIEPERIDVAGLLERAQEMLTPEARKREVALQVQPAPTSLVVHADRERLLQALGNLVSNAIRHTPAGKRVRVSAAAAEEGVRFDVVDEGEGIPEEMLENLFDRLWQTQRRRRAGAGLGLAIAKGIVDAHGGLIHAESRPGEGSRFSFVLPAGTDVARTGTAGTGAARTDAS